MMKQMLEKDREELLYIYRLLWARAIKAEQAKISLEMEKVSYGSEVHSDIYYLCDKGEILK